MTPLPRQAARLAPLLCACLLTCGALAARQATPAAAEIYRAGDTKRAVKLLREAVKRDKQDFYAWHYLALAYGDDGRHKDAREAAERAADALDKSFWDEYRTWHDDSAGAPPREERDARRARAAAALAEAISALEATRLPLHPRDAEFWRDRLDDLRLHARTAAEPERTVYAVREVTKRAVITHRPDAFYPEGLVTGVVRLRVLLGREGRVTHVALVKKLTPAMNRAAVEAARRVRFEPAERDGRKVSQWVMLEYNFQLY